MSAKLRRYDPSKDFMGVRSLLVETFRGFENPLNWRIERWNYARYFEAPYLCRDEEITPEKSEAAIRFWEESVGVWEDDQGQIVGAVHTEYPELGTAFIERHPRHVDLLEEMLDYAESHLASKEDGRLRLFVHEHDRDLLELVKRRGYQKTEDDWDYDQEYVIGDIPAPDLPGGYTVMSMADGNDLAAKGRAFGLGFNHPDPKDWVPVYVYEELQRAPDYRRDLDLCVVAPDGEIASFCIVWFDEKNRIGVLEPVATVPGHRKLGLAREVIHEAIRRVSAMGAERIIVGGGQEFYESIGFRKTVTCHGWSRTV